MSNPSPCDISRLGAVLNDQLDDPEFAHTVDHLSECSTCQTRLQQLAAGRWWWTEGRELLESSSGIDVELASPSPIIATTHDNDGLADAASERATIDFLEPPSHPELLGRLGKYEVECVVGRGGMGLVLKGLDTELNRSVAIKVLSPHLSSNAAARQRFAREARAAAAVVHDHVAGARSSGRSSAGHWRTGHCPGT